MRAFAAAIVTFALTTPAFADFDALLTYARTENLAGVKAELSAGTDPNPPSWHHGYAPLQFAAGNGDAEMTRLLLEAGADTEYRDHNGDRALLWSAYSGTPETVRLLLDAGSPADSDADPYGETALMTASWYNHEEMVRLLLTAGADPNRVDQSSLTALHFGARSGNVVLVNALLSAGANPNVFSDSLYETPLHETSDPAVIAALVAAGASLEPRDYHGHTPLHAAAAIGDGRTVAAFIAASADVDARSPDGDTPILAAIHSLGPDAGKQAAIAALAEVTEDIDRAFAASLGAGMLPVAMRLLERGADVNALDASGVSALANAARLPGMTMFQLLINRGADIDRFGVETLVVAAANGNRPIVSALLDHGVPLESRDGSGQTPLLAAVRGAQVETVRLLLSLGADGAARDSFGHGADDYLAAVTQPIEMQLERFEQSAAWHPAEELELDLGYLRENRAAIRELLAAE